MSRNKKGKRLAVGRPAEQSWNKLKHKLNDESMVSPTFTAVRSRYVKDDKLWFKYAPRRADIMKIVGKSLCKMFDRKEAEPPGWSAASSNSGLASSSNGVREFSLMMIQITPDEWTAGLISNKKLSLFKKKFRIKKHLLSTNIQKITAEAAGLHSFTDNTSLKCSADKALECLSDGLAKDSNPSKLFLSCDPWDIIRMGTGPKNFGSCLNMFSKSQGGIENSGSDNTPMYMADPSMMTCYVEDPSESSIASIVARMIVRVASSNKGNVIFADRLYGDSKYRSSIMCLLADVAKEHSLKHATLYNYNHSKANNSNNITFSQAPDFIAHGMPIMSSEKNMAYFDQTSSAKYLPIVRNEIIYPVFRLVLMDELQ